MILLLETPPAEKFDNWDSEKNISLNPCPLSRKNSLAVPEE